MEAEDRFAQLIAPIKGRMFETVWRVLRHAQDAEDALQVALTAIWRQRDTIEGHPAPQALMLKICADAAVDQYRRRRGRFEVAELDHSVPSSRPPPVDAAISRETFEILSAAIARLSPNQATAIVMRFIQGEPEAAIAAALGCGIETVREHLDRGRERLGRMLGRIAQPPQARTSPAGSIAPHIPSENKS